MNEIENLKLRIQEINEKITLLLNERYKLEDDLRSIEMDMERKRDKRPAEMIPINELILALPIRFQSDVSRVMIDNNICNLGQLVRPNVLNRLELQTHVYKCVKDVLFDRFRLVPLL